MARAIAKCTCKKCGKNFEIKRYLQNSQAAYDWQKWAENNLYLCPACYGEIKRAEKNSQANEIIEKYNLPQIDPNSGTEKQIAYAISLRSEWLTDNEITIKEFAKAKAKVDTATEEKLARYAKSCGTEPNTNAIWRAVLSQYPDKRASIAIYSTNAKEIIENLK